MAASRLVVHRVPHRRRDVGLGREERGLRHARKDRRGMVAIGFGQHVGERDIGVRA